ncbi:MAG: hypothetical protein ACUVUG_05110 [Candidatus Aminicenantia bacterium]
MKRVVFIALFFWGISLIMLFAKEFSLSEQLKKSAPKVFIDCEFCDHDFIRTEISFVNYVRDRKVAQVHVLITTQKTGGGGTEYTLTFIGQKEFEGMEDVLKYVSKKTDTEDEERKGLVKTLKMGLIRFVAKSPIASIINISTEEEVTPTAVEDKWNFWVFNISGHGFFNGEKLQRSYSLGGNFSANRITPELKVRLGVSANLAMDSFTYDEEKIKNYSRSQSFNGLIVKSINQHFSIGAWLYLNSSTFDNLKFSINPAPAIEYNIFPYSQSTRRQLKFLYNIGYLFQRYREETIYDKTSENLWNEALSINFDLREKWGSLSFSLKGSHYFHNFNKNRMEILTDLSLRISKGLSLNVFGVFARIRDQLSLPKAGASLEEVLLRRRMLETSYSYFFSVGLSYTFGSIYSNVVNPRFGDIGKRRVWIYD